MYYITLSNIKRTLRKKSMAIVKEFKEFISKGNVIDLAVGVIIGAAFGKIITSLVDDVLMPPIGFLTGGVDFADKKVLSSKPNKINKKSCRFIS